MKQRLLIGRSARHFIRKKMCGKRWGLLFITFFTAHLFASPDGFRPLFNGKDLTGWDGNPTLSPASASSLNSK